MLEIPRHGRDRKLSSQFRMLLRAPEVIVPEFLPIQPNALNFCRNHGHLAGTRTLFNFNILEDYTKKIRSISTESTSIKAIIENDGIV